jgi:modulator of FtsH protease HflK
MTSNMLFEKTDEGLVIKPFGIIGVVLALFLISAIWTSWFTVDKSQQALTFTLGKHTGTFGSGGPYLMAPWPFGSVEKTDIQSVEEIGIGYGYDKDGQEFDIPDESESLTSDSKTVMIDSTLQYSRADAASWMFKINDPEKVIALLGKSALRGVTAARTFDQILTTERTAAQVDSETFLRDTFTKMGLSINLVALQIQDTQPPPAVRQAFADVATAQEEKNRMINEATGYKQGRIAEANGQAKKTLEQATAYKSTVVNDAKGQTERFSLVYTEYVKSPTLTRQRMQYEAIEASLSGKAQVIDMSSNNGTPTLKFFDVGAFKSK